MLPTWPEFSCAATPLSGRGRAAVLGVVARAPSAARSAFGAIGARLRSRRRVGRALWKARPRLRGRRRVGRGPRRRCPRQLPTNRAAGRSMPEPGRMPPTSSMPQRGRRPQWQAQRLRARARPPGAWRPALRAALAIPGAVSTPGLLSTPDCSRPSPRRSAPGRSRPRVALGPRPGCSRPRPRLRQRGALCRDPAASAAYRSHGVSQFGSPFSRSCEAEGSVWGDGRQSRRARRRHRRHVHANEDANYARSCVNPRRGIGGGTFVGSSCRVSPPLHDLVQVRLPVALSSRRRTSCSRAWSDAADVHSNANLSVKLAPTRILT